MPMQDCRVQLGALPAIAILVAERRKEIDWYEGCILYQSIQAGGFRAPSAH